MATKALAKRIDFDPEHRQIIKDMYAADLSDVELETFLGICRYTGQDPLRRQVYPVKRWNKKLQREVIAVQTSVDGYRSIAEDTKEYVGQVGPWWCGKDGQWRDVWLDPGPPVAAKVGVLRKGFKEPVTAVALWTSSVQRLSADKGGGPSQFWSQRGPEMLAKCAEVAAFRKAFPQQLAHLATNETIEQDTSERDNAVVIEDAVEPVGDVAGEGSPPVGTTDGTPSADPNYVTRVAAARTAVGKAFREHGIKGPSEALAEVRKMILAAGGEPPLSLSSVIPAEWLLMGAQIETWWEQPQPLREAYKAVDAQPAGGDAMPMMEAPALVEAEPVAFAPPAEDEAVGDDKDRAGFVDYCQAAEKRLRRPGSMIRDNAKGMWFCNANAMRDAFPSEPPVTMLVWTDKDDARSMLVPWEKLSALRAVVERTLVKEKL